MRKLSLKGEPNLDVEKFALYGFELKIPNTWRVEITPKCARDKGDVVFCSPRNNRIYVSWGPLEEASRRFKTIEEQRDQGIKALRKSRDVRQALIDQEEKVLICGHTALSTHVSASVAEGFFGQKLSSKSIETLYFHCRDTSRYYIIYSTLNSREEYPDFPMIFELVTRTLICHSSTSTTER